MPLLNCPRAPALHRGLPPSSTRQHDAPGSWVSWMWARPCRAATQAVVTSSTVARRLAGRTSPGTATVHRMNFGPPSPRPGSWMSSRHGARWDIAETNLSVRPRGAAWSRRPGPLAQSQIVHRAPLSISHVSAGQHAVQAMRSARLPRLTRPPSAPGRNQWSPPARLVGAQNAQNWTASTVIDTEPKSPQNEGGSARVLQNSSIT